MALGKRVSYIEVDSYDFEQLVEKTYGVEYCYQADVEVGNDTRQTYTVEKGQNTDKWEADELATFKAGGGYSYTAGTILNDLADMDIIEEGDYLITLSY